MAASFSFSVSGVPGVVGKLELYQRKTTKLVRRVVFDSSLSIQKRAKKNCPVDTGRLRSSIEIELLAVGLVGKIGSAVPYALYVEKGTKPHFPPTSALRGWSRRVISDEGLAYVVARKIAAEGTKAQPFLLPAWNDEIPRYQRNLEKAFDGVRV